MAYLEAHPIACTNDICNYDKIYDDLLYNCLEKDKEQLDHAEEKSTGLCNSLLFK